MTSAPSSEDFLDSNAALQGAEGLRELCVGASFLRRKQLGCSGSEQVDSTSPRREDGGV